MRCHLFAMSIFQAASVMAAELPRVAFQRGPNDLLITIGQEHVATYTFRDSDISRPFFAHVRAPGGIQVTRNHPPIPDQDATDHPEYHPGIWLAFGDISNNDYWRMRATVKHDGFLDEPSGGAGQGTFAVRNRYLASKGHAVVCTEICRYRVLVRPHGFLLIWDSQFGGDREFYFGDQEEMGLGVRVATPLAVGNGGRMVNSDGLVNERELWGKQADWCDYSGQIDGFHAGITLMPDPANFRRSWYHARDYGFVAANAFGRAAFGKGPKSKVVISPGQSLRLRYGILLHSKQGQTSVSIADAYQDFLRQIE